MARETRLKQQGTALARQALDSSEAALHSVGDYLGVRTPEPASSSVEDAAAFVGGLLFGAMLAAGAAILLAPTDGQTFRRRLRDKWQELLGGVSNVPERSYYPAGQTSPEMGADQSVGMADDMDDIMTLRAAQRVTVNPTAG